jgi:hypothetical protein
MFVIRNSNNEIVALCSHREDADAFLSAATADKETYTIENLAQDEESFLQLEDGIGEGQLL